MGNAQHHPADQLKSGQGSVDVKQRFQRLSLHQEMLVMRVTEGLPS